MGDEEVIREMQCIDPEFTTVLTSGFSEQELARRVTEGGHGSFILKPLRIEQLDTVLRRTLRDGKASPATDRLTN